MIKAPVSLQDLRRRLYIKAKTEPTWRFWGLYVHVCKRETLREAYQLAKSNDGAPGIDGVTFEAIEAEGVEGFLDRLREELEQRSYGKSYSGTKGETLDTAKDSPTGHRASSRPYHWQLALQDAGRDLNRLYLYVASTCEGYFSTKHYNDFPEAGIFYIAP